MKLLLPAAFLLLPLTAFAQIDVAPPDGPGCPPACVPPPTVVTARAITATTPWNAPLWIQFLGSTTGAGPLVYATSSSPAHGSLGAIAANTVLYTPAARYVGMDEFTYSAADNAFVSGVASVSIEVTDPIDTTSPTFSTPIDQTFATTTFPAQPALIPPSVSDDFDSDPQLIYSPLVFPLGTTTVTWTATDASGNSAATTSLVLIVDSTPVETTPPPTTEDAVGPIGNGPPVGYLPSPATTPTLPAAQLETVPIRDIPVHQEPLASLETLPTSTAKIVPTAAAVPAYSIPVVAARTASRTGMHAPTTTSIHASQVQEQQVAAAARAVPQLSRAYDYIGLLVLLLLVLLAAIYEWRRERRLAESDL